MTRNVKVKNMDDELVVEDLDKPEEELDSDKNYFTIPTSVKLLITLPILGFWAWSFTIYRKHIFDPVNYVSPSSLGLPAILLFTASILFLLHLPWKKMGLRIKKIGAIEFEEIIKTQASEHTEEIAYLQSKITQIELKFSKQVNSAAEQLPPEDDIKNLILSFLTEYSQWSFSPLRIQNWGVKQPNFQRIGQHSLPTIKRKLRELVAENKLATRLSKKGNTLYRVPK